MKRHHIAIAILGVGLFFGLTRSGGGPAVGGTATVAAGAKDSADAMKSFKMDAGVKAELFANEPLLANGVAFAPDDRGRWFVAETYRQEGRRVNGKPVTGGVVDNRGHMSWLDDDIASRTTADRLAMMRKHVPDPKKFKEMFETEEERIVMVEDTNGDGRADKATVFADGFRDALDGTGAGIIARGNEVWWTCIPNLWRFEDPNGNGTAKTKDRLLTGFGVKFAFRGHDMHGLRFGPDGKLYFSIGDRAINVTGKEGRAWELSDTGCVMRCNPDGTAFEVVAIGLRNPQELAFDEFGNLFTADNNSDSGDRARFVQIVEGGDCGWRMPFQYIEDRGPWNRELLWDEREAPNAKYLIPPVANLSNGPSGLTWNPGTGLGKKYAGKFFLSDFRGGAAASVVHEIALEPAGAWHRLKERRDFLKGVLTTDVEFGPDGALYVLDWVEGWSGVDKGRIFKFTSADADVPKQTEVRTLLAAGMAHRADGELEKLLGHEDQRIRQAAQFALAAKGAVPVLSNAAKTGAGTFARIHGVWGLGQIAAKKPEVLGDVAALLADGDQEVRAQAARVLGDHRYAMAMEKLTALLKDPYPRARFYAAIAIGKVAHKGAVQPLFEMLAANDDKDPILRHGAVMGLAGCADPESLAARAGDPNRPVRIGALLALRRQKSPLVAAFTRDADQAVVLEAARAIHDVPIPQAFPALGELLVDRRVSDRNILLRVVNAHYRMGANANAAALAQCAADPQAGEIVRVESLAALGEWANPNPKDRLTFQWRPLPGRSAEAAVTALAPLVPVIFSKSHGRVQEAAAAASAKLGIPGAGAALFEIAANATANREARAQALSALLVMKDAKLADAAKEVLKSDDSRLRAAGLKALVGADGDAALAVIGGILDSKALAIEKQGAVLALAESNTPAAEKLIGGLLDDLIAGKLAPEVRLDVYEAAKRRGGLAQKVATFRGEVAKKDPLENHKLSLFGGNAERGKKIFREHQAVQCFKCHRCEGGDSLVGPDLTKIGAQKDRTYLLESIIFPNKTIADGYQIVVLGDKAGATIAGRLLSEKDGKIEVETVDAAGKLQKVVVEAKNVTKRTGAPSAMPETIRGQLSRSDLRDVIEYLANLK